MHDFNTKNPKNECFARTKPVIFVFLRCHKKEQNMMPLMGRRSISVVVLCVAILSTLSASAEARKQYKEGQELDSEQEGALPDTSGDPLNRPAPTLHLLCLCVCVCVCARAHVKILAAMPDSASTMRV